MPDDPIISNIADEIHDAPQDPEAAAIESKMLLARECKTVLGLQHFIDMLEKGMELAHDMMEKAVDDMKPVEEIQRHNGAKKAIRDLIHDIKRMSQYQPPKVRKEGEKPRRPLYE